MQRAHRQATSTDKCVMLPQQHFHGSNPGAARRHWTAFEKYSTFQIRQCSVNTIDEFKNMFALTLTDIEWNWFESIMNNIPDMPTLKEDFMKGFNFMWT